MHMMLRTIDTLIGKSYDEHEVSVDSSEVASSRGRDNGDATWIIRRFNEIHDRVGKIVVPSAVSFSARNVVWWTPFTPETRVVVYIFRNFPTSSNSQPYVVKREMLSIKASYPCQRIETCNATIRGTAVLDQDRLNVHS